MSQGRQKKQLTMMDNINSLTDHQLREALKRYDQSPGPITDSTRNLYRKKLLSLIEADTATQSMSQKPAARLIDDDDDDTSDEDFNVQDEESDSDEEEYNEEDDEGDLINELHDDIKLSSTTTEEDNPTTALIVGSDASPNRISRGILFTLVSFFVAIFSLYLYSTNHYKLFLPFKNITKQLLVLFALSPIGYVIYRTIRLYRLRCHQKMQRVCSLVDEALELLQSPDNPKGLMPILHIRDTLLTPAERKTKKMIDLWNQAVNFIEGHESRVKVELVNIDGEDFRAWKWIGSRKM